MGISAYPPLIQPHGIQVSQSRKLNEHINVRDRNLSVPFHLIAQTETIHRSPKRNPDKASLRKYISRVSRGMRNVEN